MKEKGKMAPCMCSTATGCYCVTLATTAPAVYVIVCGIACTKEKAGGVLVCHFSRTQGSQCLIVPHSVPYVHSPCLSLRTACVCLIDPQRQTFSCKTEPISWQMALSCPCHWQLCSSSFLCLNAIKCEKRMEYSSCSRPCVSHQPKAHQVYPVRRSVW